MVPAGSVAAALAMEAIRNTILKVETIWEIFLEICSKICFMGRGGFGGSTGGFHQQSYRMKGEDLHADVNVSFDDAAFGCERADSSDQPGWNR